MKINYIIFSVFLAILAVFAVSSYNVAFATISSGSVQASSTADLVVGAIGADYKVSFDTNTNATATIITVTFPVGYTISETLTATSVCSRDCATSAKITASSTEITVSSVAGSLSARTIAITLDTETKLNSTTTAFQIIWGITNATTSGATATSSITTNATGETAQTNIAGVTLTAGPATQLVFTRQASSTTSNGNVISGIVFGQQPTFAARDQYGNTSTTYNGTILLTASSSAGGTLGGTTSVVAVNGVATTTNLKYTVAAADQETFQILGNQGSLATATSSTYTADVVATLLVFTTQPAGAVTGVFLTTQPVVAARDAGSLVNDVNFTSVVSLSPTSTTAYGSVANGTQAAVAGIATFTSAIYNPSADSETFKLAAISGSLISADSNSLIGYFFRGVGSTVYTTPVQTATVSAPSAVLTTPLSPTTLSTTTPSTTTPSVTAPTTISGQQELLNTLISQLKTLLQQAASLGIVLPAGTEYYLTPSKLSDTVNNLSVGSVGDEVKTLQQFLNSKGFTLAQSGPGSPGNETTRFGALTKTALAKLQKAVGISPASGNFGPKTKEYLKSIGF